MPPFPCGVNRSLGVTNTEMGIVMNNKPSMRQTVIGKALLTEARVKMNPKHYEKIGIIDSDFEADKDDAA